MEKEQQTYIVIKTDEGNLIKRRILTIYQLEDPKKNYVIFYDDSVDEIKEFYVASYDADTDFKNINTNLTELELKSANKILEVIKEKFK